MASSMAQASSEETCPNGRRSTKLVDMADSGEINLKLIDAHPHALIETSKEHDIQLTSTKRGGRTQAPAPCLSLLARARRPFSIPYPLTVS